MNLRTKKIIFSTIVVLILAILFVMASQVAKQNVQRYENNRIKENSVVEPTETPSPRLVTPAEDSAPTNGLVAPF